MNSYSADLREWVMKAWQNQTGTQAEIAETFAVNVSTVKAWVKRFRETGNVEPLPRGCEQPLIKDDQAGAVQALVDHLPEATLAQYCDAWEQATGQRVSAACQRCVARCSALTAREKKRPSPPLNGMKSRVLLGVNCLKHCPSRA